MDSPVAMAPTARSAASAAAACGPTLPIPHLAVPPAPAAPVAAVAPPTLRIAAAASAGKGRGVFALAAIAAGEIVETACTIVLDAAACAAVEATPLGDYYFAHPADDSAGLLVLGLASLCNHADAPSVDTVCRHDAGLGWQVLLVAARDIAPGEEITRRYACPPWFEVRG